MANIAYIRVSTIEQNEQRQIEGLEKYNIDKWFIEKVSGKNTDRKELQIMFDYVRADDTIYIHDFSRLARNTKDLLDLVERLNASGVGLVSNKEKIDSRTPAGKLMLTMLGAIYEFERTNLLERQREGIEIAKRKGVYKGRKAVSVDSSHLKILYVDYQHRRTTKGKIARVLNVSRPTLDKLLKQYGLE